MSSLESKLLKILPKERVRTRLIDRIAFSSDAGFYRLVPEAVVQPSTVEEVRELFKLSAELSIPITFRTGGTSLSGQSVTEGILVDLSQHWRKISPENEGRQVRVQPGAIGSWVNIALKKFGAKIGPDPSSIASAMMGGILANNASGMCCGVKHNSYHTLHSIRFLLPSGREYNTEVPSDYLRFEKEEPLLHSKLIELRHQVLHDQGLVLKIREKYRLKNTVGYSINSFLDFEHPLDIFAHLLVGSEGTLGFIAEAVLDTMVDLPYKATSLLLFSDISYACDAIVPLTESGAEAVELMDWASIKAVEHLEGLPEEIKTLSEGSAALLVEYQESTVERLKSLLNSAQPFLASLPTCSPILFSYDPLHQGKLWKIRKGLFPAVGAVRAQGTTVILEDVAFPVHSLAAAVKDLQNLFLKYRYDNAIIFGHAKDGNLHFVITQAFEDELETKRYADFIQEMVDLVVSKYNGSLKAEHGTGRNMAPFVETEWGPEAYFIMKEVKELVDPGYLLNPGVIIAKDPQIHLKHLKPLPVVEEEVDKCIECGFCERLCPSRDITLTPRRRIVVRRNLKSDTLTPAQKKELWDQYQYDGIETCAVDGMCATDCPVDINTGDLIKRFRREGHAPQANSLALRIAKNLNVFEAGIVPFIWVGANFNKILNSNILYHTTKSIRRGNVRIPQWMKSLKGPSPIRFAKDKPAVASNAEKVVFFGTCVQRTMGENGKTGLLDTLDVICHRSDIQLVVSDSSGHCCGQAFSSKGFTEAAKEAATRTIKLLWDTSNEGQYPILVDTSSCAYTLTAASPLLEEEELEKWRKLKFMDVVEFASDILLGKLEIKRKKKKVALHPVCSLEKMKLKPALLKVANACAEEVVWPIHASCCGMAGDRGFLYPELTAAATKMEAEEINAHVCEGYYSTSRSCELAISEATGKNFVSLLYLLEEVS